MLVAVLKRVEGLGAYVLSRPAFIRYLLLKQAVGADYALVSIGQRAARWAGRGGNLMRSALLKSVGLEIDEEVSLSYGCLITSRQASFRSRSYVGPYSIIGAAELGRDTMVADHVTVLGGRRGHHVEMLETAMRDQGGTTEFITLGEDCWIGSHAVVMANVGAHAIVGAGSVVTRPIPAYAIAVGAPARVIRDRRESRENG
jgi:acetyltransferase-like isoleucine patch superfamily enzyme